MAGAKFGEYETGWSLELELSGERQELSVVGCACDEDGDIGGLKLPEEELCASGTDEEEDDGGEELPDEGEGEEGDGKILEEYWESGGADEKSVDAGNVDGGEDDGVGYEEEEESEGDEWGEWNEGDVDAWCVIDIAAFGEESIADLVVLRSK